VQLESATDRFVSDHIGQRYVVRQLLGRGGMARVYRVFDTLNERDVALKHWVGGSAVRAANDREHDARRASLSQFEYEYHTLAQLCHPCVIEVYDYGLGDRGPYFTMELLAGGDLREQAPMPWRRACHVFYDICSSLALLHSRRLIHRDVSPRNIRCTAKGTAKLIDFGAMLPMGSSLQVVGTPAFVAPEVVQGLPLDGRVDLYSLGATLYFALTGQQVSSARDFSQVLQAAHAKRVAPSRCVPEIPAALDALVLSLLEPEPALRPRSAFEVMQRLAAIGRLEAREPLSVARAYLATPQLIGRDPVVCQLRQRCAEALAGRGGTVVIESQPGMGRSRVLDACALWAKTLGAKVVRARAAHAKCSDYSLLRALTEQLVDALPPAFIAAERARQPDFDALFEHAAGAPHPLDDAPEDTMERTAPHVLLRRRARLISFRTAGLSRKRVQSAVARCAMRAAELYPLVIAIDDLQAADASHNALLYELAEHARYHRLLLALTRPATDGGQAALPELPGAITIGLSALTRDETAELFGSVFGDVPHVALLSDRVHALSDGNPGDALEITRWLIERNVIRYAGGSWSLPADLALSDLPACAADAVRARLASLSPLAHALVTAQALSLQHGFHRDEYRALAAISCEADLDAALIELSALRVIEAEHHGYTLTASAAKVLRESLCAADAVRAHRALSRYYASCDAPSLHLVYHLRHAGAERLALDQLLTLLRELGRCEVYLLFAGTHISPDETATMLGDCLAVAGALGRPENEQQVLRRWLALISVYTHDDDCYYAAGPDWLAQLERDSGLAHWRALARIDDREQRLRRALQAADQAHQARPHAERVDTPANAVRHLVEYVTCSLAIAARRLDAELLSTLPGLLEPFAKLTPEIEVVWQMALAAEEFLCRCQIEHARARWLDVYAQLDRFTPDVMCNVDALRNAVAYAIGTAEASLGMQSARHWAERLDDDPLHAVNAMYLRKALRIQLGDFDSAERYRRKAERLSIHAETAQLFTSTLVLELAVHALAGDLLGVKQLADRIAPLAKRLPSWVPYQHLASAYFERLRGNPSAALGAFETCLDLSTDSGPTQLFGYAWPLAAAGLAETLMDLEHHAQAARLARLGVDRCEQAGANAIAQLAVRALALAESKLGQHARAVERLEAAIARAQDAGVTGLHLGTLYEARACVAIEAGDRDAAMHYLRATAREYRYGLGSPLGARCERLLDAAGLDAGELLAWAGARGPESFAQHHRLGSEISRAMAGAESAEGLAARALRLLCDHHGANAGHLYLVDEHGLRLAASLGADPPDEALRELAIERMQADLRNQENVTRVDGDSGVRCEHDTRALWTDQHGQPFEPRILHCTQNGAPRCAGVALLAQTPLLRRATHSAQLTTVVSAYLINAGETSGI
jgi:hypothetical protein